MEETFSAGLDRTTPLSPPLQLRAEIAPASAQGSTAGHPPPNNYAAAGCRWMSPYPKHSEAALGHLTPEKEIKAQTNSSPAPQEQKDGGTWKAPVESTPREHPSIGLLYSETVKPRKPGIHE